MHKFEIATNRIYAITTGRVLEIDITSKPDYAVEAFDPEVIDYLVKPVQLPCLTFAFDSTYSVND